MNDFQPKVVTEGDPFISLSFSFKRIKRLCDLGGFIWRQNIIIWWPGCCSEPLRTSRAAFLDYLSIPCLPFLTSPDSLTTSIQFLKSKWDIPSYRKPFLTVPSPPTTIPSPQPTYPNRVLPLPYLEGTSMVAHFSLHNYLYDFSSI